LAIVNEESLIQMPLRVLHLEDSPADHELVRRALSKAHSTFDLDRVESLEQFEEQLQAASYDVILADYRLPGFTAVEAWSLLQKLTAQAAQSSPPFILLSGAIGEPAAVSAIKIGMSDYLAKDNLSRLPQIIQRAIEVQKMRRAKELADAELALSERRLAEFSVHLQKTIEQERAAIAREIHDDIGGALAAIRFDLSWIGRHVSDSATQEHVDAATKMLQHALDASQRIMMNLRPAILDQGLVAAIQWLTEDFTRRTGVKTTLRASQVSSSPSKTVQLAAYRTAQESLTNIVKHAQCTQVTIDLSDAEGVLTLEITDNGKGITQTERDKPKAFGIKGLHERAKSVGGWLDVSTQPNVGTSIILSVPLTSQLDTQEGN
jgi:two-component system, NarL family, sensor histidine kinase UhpB